MKKVRFYDRVEDSLLRFAVIIARSGDQWVFCKHRERDTYEVPGGHREPGEDIETAARRELYEETGALVYTLTPYACILSLTGTIRTDRRVSACCILPESRLLNRNCTARSRRSS